MPVPSLEHYLSNLLRRGTHLAHKEALDLEEFFFLLRDSFDDSDNIPRIDTVENPARGFRRWQSIISKQIQDLREMEEKKQLRNQLRYFGNYAPSGRIWFNFDPLTYLECGAAGSIGGWEEGDETGRSYISGQVAYRDSEGKMTSCDPREIDEPIVEVPQITWQMFIDFIRCGQYYE